MAFVGGADALNAERYGPAAPDGGATGAPLASVTLAEEAAAGVPPTGIRNGGRFGSIVFIAITNRATRSLVLRHRRTSPGQVQRHSQ